jgi:hypothetical protein
MSAFRYEISWGVCLDTLFPVIHGHKTHNNLKDAWKELRRLRIENPRKEYDFERWPAAPGPGMRSGKMLVAVRPVNHDRGIAARRKTPLTAS